jgi:hypothetical protein
LESFLKLTKLSHPLHLAKTGNARVSLMLPVPTKIPTLTLLWLGHNRQIIMENSAARNAITMWSVLNFACLRLTQKATILPSKRLAELKDWEQNKRNLTKERRDCMKGTEALQQKEWSKDQTTKHWKMEELEADPDLLGRQSLCCHKSPWCKILGNQSGGLQEEGCHSHLEI